MDINIESRLPSPAKDNSLRVIQSLDASLINYFSDKFVVDRGLTRKIVSFQSNKKSRYYKFYKYKEAFSSELVERMFKLYPAQKGKICDPFAGSGVSLFACSKMGYDAEGVELLPLGQKIIEANILIRNRKKKGLAERLEQILSKSAWSGAGKTETIKELRITKGAYPQETEYRIKRYLYEARGETEEVKNILIFALLCILESVSYTRKDGQFLRWDSRSGRGNGSNFFNKGRILLFDQAIRGKLKEIIGDMNSEESNMDLFSFMGKSANPGKISLLKGSCLRWLPKIRPNSYTGIITSPPYCNRYDYTRTYALELAILGIGEKDLLALRQSLLSCTVENKAKNLLFLNKSWKKALDICDNLPLLYEILHCFEQKKERNELNNRGIARMVKSYFYEMACVIQECYRVLKNNSYMFMANDNVKYAGVSLSVDMICSKIAESLGFQIKNILVLPQKKGNSSQQMGQLGREELRKCVYVWKKER